MLHLLQGFFLLYKAELILLYRCLFLRYGRFHLKAPVYFLLLLLIEIFIGNIESFQRSFCQFNAELFIFLFDLIIFLRLLCLAFQAFELVIDLKKKVFNTCKILLGGIQLQLCLFFSRFVNSDAGSLFQHTAAAVFLVFNNIIHHAQLNNSIAVGAYPGIKKKIVYVFEAAVHIVEPVFAFAAFIKFSCNGYRAEFGRQQVACILKCKAHLSQSAGASCL